MSLFQLAQEIYTAIKDNPASDAQIRSEYASLALLLATDPEKSFQISGATVNGQTFNGVRSMNNQQRLRMLGDVIAMLDEDSCISETSQAIF